MSGIDEIKKKAKLSIDEMYDNQSVGKLDNQTTRHTDSHKDVPPTLRSNSNTSEHINDDMLKKQNEQLVSQKYTSAETQKITETEKLMYRPKMRPQMIIEPTFKMTFNLPAEIYKAFNDLYAHRMLNGYKTEKSELICEAIKLLIDAENN